MSDKKIAKYYLSQFNQNINNLNHLFDFVIANDELNTSDRKISDTLKSITLYMNELRIHVESLIKTNKDKIQNIDDILKFAIVNKNLDFMFVEMVINTSNVKIKDTEGILNMLIKESNYVNLETMKLIIHSSENKIKNPNDLVKTLINSQHCTADKVKAIIYGSESNAIEFYSMQSQTQSPRMAYDNSAEHKTQANTINAG